MPDQTNRPSLNVIETKTAAAASPRQPQHAWEMTLEQFRERFFPELFGDGRSTTTESVPHRNAA